jgi:glyoxylase-like metal-dependent hydrolase (beta-lactamase superfamily II)
MKTFHSRRSFVKSVTGAGLALGVLGATGAAAQGRSVLRAQTLGDGLLLVQGAGANVVVAKDAGGLVFVDGGLRDQAPALLKFAQQALDAKHAHTLINTHWHPQQTGLNALLGKQGAKIIAHENTRLWLSTSVRYQADDAPILPLPKFAQPNSTTYDKGELQVGDEIARYGYLSQAHTDGDLYVHFVKANVLVTGGVVAGNDWPTADWVTGGWINGTVSGHKTLIDLCNDSTRVVSANGENLLSRADLESERQMLAKIADAIGKMLRSGYGPSDMLAAQPARDYVVRMGDPTRFLTESFKSLWPRMAPDA